MAKTLGYIVIVLGVICLVVWGMNVLGWVRLGDPTGQILIAPVCVALGLMLLRRRPAK
jgi:hypothetical protein